MIITTNPERLRSGSNTEEANSPLNVKEMNKRNHQRGGTVIKNDKQKYKNVIVELKNEPNGFDEDAMNSDQFKYI